VCKIFYGPRIIHLKVYITSILEDSIIHVPNECMGQELYTLIV